MELYPLEEAQREQRNGIVKNGFASLIFGQEHSLIAFRTCRMLDLIEHICGRAFVPAFPGSQLRSSKLQHVS